MATETLEKRSAYVKVNDANNKTSQVSFGTMSTESNAWDSAKFMNLVVSYSAICDTSVASAHTAPTYTVQS